MHQHECFQLPREVNLLRANTIDFIPQERIKQ